MREAASRGGADCTKIVLYEAGASQTTGKALLFPLSFHLQQGQLVDLSLAHFHIYHSNFRLLFGDLIQTPNHVTIPR